MMSGAVVLATMLTFYIVNEKADLPSKNIYYFWVAVVMLLDIVAAFVTTG